MHMIVPAFNDMHQHLRELCNVPFFGKYAAMWCENIVAMPNLTYPLTTWEAIHNYRSVIKKSGVDAIVPFYMTDDCDPDYIGEMHNRGCYYGKLYPKGRNRPGTTNSHFGVNLNNIVNLYPAFDKMQTLGDTLLLHGESPDVSALHAEEHFIDCVLRPIIHTFPKLRIVLEHISTSYAVAFIDSLPGENVVATITAHHLLIYHDDTIGNTLNVCCPIAKTESDRMALVTVVNGKSNRFMLGTDSAPWQVQHKVTFGRCKNGIFTAPFTPLYLMMVMDFEAERFADFTCHNAAKFYGLPKPQRQLRIKQGYTEIPVTISGYPVFMGGQTLPFMAEQV